FPTANMAYNSSNGDYRFYAVNADSVVLVGEKSLTGTPCPYSKVATAIQFPSSLGATVTDSVEGEYFDGLFTNVTRWGSYTTTFDADGTLITPNATWNNVIRVTTTATFLDSSWTGAAISDVLVFRYEWYVPGRRMPVFWTNTQLVSINAGPFTEQRDIFYLDTTAVGIEDQTLEAGLQIYPNPAQDIVRATYVLDAPEQVQVALYDLVGNHVRTVFEGTQSAGGQLVRINTTELSSGMYILKITAGKAVATKKFVLQ
ncbi:MAG TPA: T9SS type A sorting domain-containing protein, partial [Bacteroidetes bacterium]|nr:T9SS type A sorting domain-containing protein [Bacteroidota bacterium]